MRELFIVGIKLYGVMSLFSGISDATLVIALWQSGPDPRGLVYTWLISAVVKFIIVFCAVTQAEKVANLFRLTAEAPVRFTGFSAVATLKVGLILIGLNQFLRIVPVLLKELASATDPNTAASPQSNFFVLIQVLLPIALIFGPNKIIKFLEDYAD